MKRDSIDSVIRSLRRVNLQGSFFGQTVAIRFGLSESDVEALEVLLDSGAATAGRLSELMGLTTGAVTRVIDRLEQAGYVRRVPDPGDRRRVLHLTYTRRDLPQQLVQRQLSAGVQPMRAARREHASDNWWN